jgi:hypothetical protein
MRLKARLVAGAAQAAVNWPCRKRPPLLFVRGNRVLGGGRDAERSGASRSLATTVPWYGWRGPGYAGRE